MKEIGGSGGESKTAHRTELQRAAQKRRRMASTTGCSMGRDATDDDDLMSPDNLRRKKRAQAQRKRRQAAVSNPELAQKSRDAATTARRQQRAQLAGSAPVLPRLVERPMQQQTVEPAQFLSAESAANMRLPTVVTVERLEQIAADLRAARLAAEIAACAVCARAVPRAVLAFLPVDQLKSFRAQLLVNMRTQLSPLFHEPPLDPFTQEHYKCSHVDAIFEGMLLCRLGFYESEQAAASGWTMGACHECLSSLADSRRKSPPKFSVANGNACVPLPAHLQPTVAELSLIAKATSDFCYISLSSQRIFGPVADRQRALCGHVLHVLSSGQAALWSGLPALLPVNTAALESFFVVSVGKKMTRSLLRQGLHSLLRVNPRRLADIIAFLISNNHLYRSHQIDETAMADLRSRLIPFAELAERNKGLLDEEDEHGDEKTHGSPDTASAAPASDDLYVATRMVEGNEDAIDPGIAEKHISPAGAMSSSLFLPSPDASTTSGAAALDSHGHEMSLHPVAGAAGTTFELRTSFQFANDYGADFNCKAFPHLFSTGRGGLEEHRAVRIGRDEYIRRLLTLADPCFQTDFRFLACTFDTALNLRATKATINYCTAQAADVEELAQMSTAQLHAAVVDANCYNELCDRALRAGTARPELTAAHGDVARGRKFLQGVTAGDRVSLGSDEERRKSFHQLSSLCNHFSSFGVFFTLNFHDQADPLLAQFFSRGRLFERSFDWLTPTGRVGLQRAQMSKNPVLCARWFKANLGIFFRTVLKFDMATQQAEVEPGLFGHVEAVYGCVETQKRGALHFHGVAWIKGMPRTVEDMEKLSDEDFERLTAWADSIAQESSSMHDDELTCPTEGCVGSAADFEDETEFYGRPISVLPPAAQEPKLVRCGRCHCSHTGSDLLWHSATRILYDEELLAVQRDLELSSSPQDLVDGKSPEELAKNRVQVLIDLAQNDPVAYSKTAQSNSLRTPSDRARSCIKELINNQHSFRHNVTCFKHKTIKCCRFYLPKACNKAPSSIEDTKTADGRRVGYTFKLHRGSGSSYLNSHSRFVTHFYNCNGDVKPLLAGSNSLSLYIGGYICKSQQTLDRRMLHAMAFESEARLSAHLAASGAPARVAHSPADNVRRMINKVSRTGTGSQVTSDQMMAYYLLEPQPVHFAAVPGCAVSSHPFATVCLPAARRYLQDGCLDNLRVTFAPAAAGAGSGAAAWVTGAGAVDHGHAYISSQLMDYVLRADDAEDISLLTFCSQYDIAKLSRAELAAACGDSSDSSDNDNQDSIDSNNITEPDSVDHADVIAPLDADEATWQEATAGMQSQQQQPSPSPAGDEGDAAMREERPNLLRFRFRDKHPRHRSHYMRQRKVLHVTLLRNQYLPDLTLLHVEDEQCEDTTKRDDLRELYGLTVLALFKAFRQRSDLLAPGQTWWAACNTWLSSTHVPQWVRNHLRFAQEIYVQKSLAAILENDRMEERDANLALAKELDDYENEENRHIALEEAGLDNENDRGQLILPPPAEIGLSSNDSDVGSGLSTDISLRAAMDMASPVPLIPGYVELLQERMAFALPTNRQELLAQQMQHQSEAAFPEPADGASVSDQPFYALSFDMRLVRLEAAMLTVETGPRPPVGDILIATERLRPMPSLGEVIQSFNLNHDQGKMFTMLAMKVINHILSLSADGPDDTSDGDSRAALKARQVALRQAHPELLLGSTEDPGLIFCGGRGGTGKSRVISAVTAFASKFGFPNAVCLTAYTGIAASLLGASTLNSQLKFAFNMVPFRLTDEHKKSMRAVGLLIVDECSMISQSMLVAIEKRLRAFQVGTANANKFMGGISVCFCGDLFQLPPVGGTPLSSQIIPWSAGSRMWKEKVKQVIILTQVMRQALGDPLSPVLEAIRNNRLASVVHLLNDRVIGPNLPEPAETTEVFYKNNDRIRKNVASIVASYQGGWTVFRFLMHFVDQKKLLTRADKDRLRLRAEQNLADLSGKLDLCIGSPICVTQNVCVKQRIANGTSATVYGFQFPDGASQQFREDRFKVDGIDCVCKVPVDGLGLPTLPDYIIIKVEGQTFGYAGLPVDCFPLAVYTKASVKYPLIMADGSTKNTSTGVRQFPVVLAHARSYHKVQGCTLPRIILGAFPDRQHACCMYVALSRVTSMEGVFLRHPITMQQAEGCLFDADVITEMRRLQLVETDPAQAMLELQRTLAAHFARQPRRLLQNR